MSSILSTRSARTPGCAALAALLLHGGCATPAAAPPALREPLGVLAIVPAAAAPGTRVVAFADSRPAGAARGAAQEGAATAGAVVIAGAATSGIGAAALSVAAPVFVVAGAAAGAVAGALAALPAEQVTRMHAALREAAARIDAPNALAEQLAAMAQAEPALATGAPPPAAATGSAADTVVEAGLREIGFQRCSPASPPGMTPACSLGFAGSAGAVFLLAHVRVSRAADGRTLAERSLRYASDEARFDDWAAPGARALDAAFEHGVHHLAERIVDELLLAPPVDLPEFASPGRLPGSHPLYGLCGLAPLEPPAQPLLLSEALGAILAPSKDVCAGAPLHFTPVASRQPTLRWSAFPRALDRERLEPAQREAIANVLYELRLWEADGCRRGRQVLHRTQLAAPELSLDVPLAAGRRYFWSVRARFTMHGRPAATPWSRFDPARCVPSDHPDSQYHRFVTPA